MGGKRQVSGRDLVDVGVSVCSGELAPTPGVALHTMPCAPRVAKRATVTSNTHTSAHPKKAKDVARFTFDPLRSLPEASKVPRG